MSIAPQFTNSPNNTMAVFTGIDLTDRVDWRAGDNGGILRRIYVRAVADQAVHARISMKIGGAIMPVAVVDIPPIPTGDVGTDNTPMTNILNSDVFPGVDVTVDGLPFEADDGVRVTLAAGLDDGETITVICMGGDF